MTVVPFITLTLATVKLLH